MTAERFIHKVLLENGLELSFYDSSRKIATDLWQVLVSARIQIVLEQIPLNRIDQEKKFEIVREIGEKNCYEKKITRNFIKEKQKEETVLALCESYLQNTKNYLSHPQFAERFILKLYADSQKNR